MTIEQIKRTIIEQILEIAPDIEEDEIVPDENIQRSLEIDSFDFLKIPPSSVAPLLSFVGSRFSSSIPSFAHSITSGSIYI
jgi:hypothetical protein